MCSLETRCYFRLFVNKLESKKLHRESEYKVIKCLDGRKEMTKIHRLPPCLALLKVSLSRLYLIN